MGVEVTGRRRVVRAAGSLALIAAALACLALVSVNRTAAARPSSMLADSNPAFSHASPQEPTPSPAETPTATPDPTATPEPTAAASPTATPIPQPVVLSQARVALGTEPMVADNPYDPALVAVVYQNIVWTKPICGHPAIGISRDHGATWTQASAPWGNRCVDIHAVIAWGPGPTGDTPRLWAANAVWFSTGMALSITYSDDLGKRWSTPYVQHFTKPWVGCVPIIAVDNSPLSPNFGVLYAAYNWLATPSSTSMSVLATRDGKTWAHAEVAPVSLRGVPYSWTFGERLALGRDGSAYLSFYEADMRDWDADDIFVQNTPGNIERAGFATARIHFDSRLTTDRAVWALSLAPSDRPAFNPGLQSGLDVDDGGALWLAVNDRTRSGGWIHVGSSKDGGDSWSWGLLGVSGVDNFKPTIATAEGRIFVGWHTMDRRGAIRTYFALSYDGGGGFTAPRLVTTSAFYLPAEFNDVGLRENAEFGDGLLYYTWGDARDESAVYVAVIMP